MRDYYSNPINIARPTIDFRIHKSIDTAINGLVPIKYYLWDCASTGVDNDIFEHVVNPIRDTLHITEHLDDDHNAPSFLDVNEFLEQL